MNWIVSADLPTPNEEKTTKVFNKGKLKESEKEKGEPANLLHRG